jgi:uncharacterized protein (DUF111 family)
MLCRPSSVNHNLAFFLIFSSRIRIKTDSRRGRIVAAKPEFTDCASATKKHNVAVKTVLEVALDAYRRTTPKGSERA